jgi:hypothetical protein
MRYTQYNQELVDAQLLVRREVLALLLGGPQSEREPELPAAVEPALTRLVEATKDTTHGVFFTNYRLLVRGVLHLLRWDYQELHAEAGAGAQLKAARANLRQVQVAQAGYPAPFQEQLRAWLTLVPPAVAEPDVPAVGQAFMRLAFPTIYIFARDPFQSLRSAAADQAAAEGLPPLLLSAEFSVQGEPWANPQVLRPAEFYTIRGTLTPNYWPQGYERLILAPVSTAGSALYDLSLPIVQRQEATSYELTGHVVFKYPQSNFDDAMAVRLVAYYEDGQGQRIYPALIGYDQLVAQVLDPDLGYFPTGFKAMNRVVFDAVTTIRQQLPMLARQELTHFAGLLSGIVNYQGFCLQHGVYKEQEQVSEDDFRDQLIQHLVRAPYVGEHIVKEGHLAGGRVEISFHGVVAELKVEKSISDRTKLLAKYGKQAAAYAAANTRQLSIVCVLDLTKKTAPPAPPQNSVRLYTPTLHGFEQDTPAHDARQVLVVIEGNTRKPSAYSR